MPSKYDLEIADLVASCYADPLKFVTLMWPWGEPGMLQKHSGPDEWQTAMLKDVGRLVEANQFDGFTPVPAIRKVVSSGHGIGKACHCESVIFTPTGRRRFGDLRVGDAVFAEDGTPTAVTGVFPQGMRPLYRVTFDDGTTADVDADHLWKVKGRNERRFDREWVNLTTAQILARGVTRPNGKARAKQWEIPCQGAAQFPARPVPLHPYTLGVWLGDGGRKSSIVTSADPEIINRLRSHGERVTKHVGFAWNVSGLRAKLKALGIHDRYSYQKSVPVAYMENAPEVRADVLRGLLDTDGECGRQGSIVFSSASLALAKDVMWLARSLGGKARLQPTTKAPFYRDRDGTPVLCRPCHRVTLTMPSGFRSFYVARKQARVSAAVESRYLSRWIAAITPIAHAQAMCITVAHPSKCFLIEDFIVTHNSVMVAFLVHWIMATRPHAQGTVTANTITQLQTKTWAAVTRWNKLCLCGHWFLVNQERMFHPKHKASWFCALQNSKKENAEAFAGQHAADSTSFYIVDESSAIDDVILETAEGGLTDGEPMIFAFGNPTRSYGFFHRACFGSARHRWNPTIIDSRTSRFTNKAQIAEWIQDYGEDSDFVRVRVKGLPPAASDLQFIDLPRVTEAQKRAVQLIGDEPLVVGLDVARGGEDTCVFYFRRGTDARSIKPITIPGEQARDSMRLARQAAEILSTRWNGLEVAHLFIDGTGIGGPIADRVKELGHKNVTEVGFGSEAPDAKMANMRAYMWDRLKSWLPAGAIPEDPTLESDLTGPGYHHDSRDRLVLESKESMKKRGVASPDHGDGLALTFAATVKAPSLGLSTETPTGLEHIPPESAWMM